MCGMSDLDILIQEAAQNISAGDREIKRLLADAMHETLNEYFERDCGSKPIEYKEFVVLAMDYGTTSYHVHVLIRSKDDYEHMFRIGCKYRHLLRSSGARDLPVLKETLAKELAEADLVLLVPRKIDVDTIWCDGSCETAHRERDVRNG